MAVATGHGNASSAPVQGRPKPVVPPLDLAAGCTEPSLWATVVKVTLLVEVISSLELYSTASIILS